MKNTIGMAAIMGVLALSSAGFAAPGNSEAGDARYLSQPGAQQAADVGAQCGSGAVSGAFGYYGKDNNRGVQSPNHPDRGAGTDHGFNNAVVCGNPPTSAPPLP